MSNFFLLIAVALSVSFECSVNAQTDKPKAKNKIHNLPGYSEDYLELWSIRPGYGKSDSLVLFDSDKFFLRIADYRNKDKNFPFEQIKNQVELRLAQSNIEVTETLSDNDIFFVSFEPDGEHKYDITFKAKANRGYFIKDDILYRLSQVDLWNYRGIVGKDRLRSAIDTVMDAFLLDLLKSKKKHEDFKKFAPKSRAPTPSKK